MADATLDNLVRKLERFTGHPATDFANPGAVPAGGVFSRDDLEGALLERVWRADREPLDYTLAGNGSGATAVWSPLTDWDEGVALALGDGSVVTPDTSRPLEGRWEFNVPHQYPVYITGRTFDVHAAAADLLVQWAAKVKLEHDLSIGDLKLQRKQKYDMLVDMAANHRARVRLQSAPIVQPDVLVTGYDYRRATKPPPM